MPRTEDPLLAAQPETAAALARARDAAWEATDPELLELCRRRVEALLTGADAGPGPDGLGEREQAFLAFCDQFVFSVASVSEQDVAALLEHAGHVEVYEFVAALYALEMSRRIELTAGIVLAAEEVSA
jgi:alkylhydroperoxidase family enzyme